MARVVRQRQLMTEELASGLEFLNFVEEHVTETGGYTPRLTLEQVMKWNESHRRLYLAEAFLNTKSNSYSDISVCRKSHKKNLSRGMTTIFVAIFYVIMLQLM